MTVRCWGRSTLRHGSRAPLPRDRRRVAALTMPWCAYLLALVLLELPLKIILLLLCNVVVELD